MKNMKLLSQANTLVMKKEFAAAEKIYLELLTQNPNDDLVLAFLGRLYIKQGKYKGAERVLTNAYNHRKTAPIVASLAFCKYKLKKYDEAVIYYEELFRYDNDSPKIYEKIIESFRELGMYKFSHAYSLKFHLKHPDNEKANAELTRSYMDIGEIKKAEECCATTIQKFPQSGSTWIIAGTIQEFLYCNEELAQECYKTAIENGCYSAYYHLGVSYQKVGDYKSALDAYNKVLEYFPKEENLHAALGTLYLAQKDIYKGYEYFQKREKTREIDSLTNPWDGKDYPENTLLYYCDQGFGDNIQFIRYIPFLKPKFKEIKILTREECLDLFKRNYEDDTVKIYSNLNDLGEYNFYTLSSDIPYYLKMDFDNIPFSSGYLKPDETKKEYFKTKYFNTDKPKIGLCWKAGGEGVRSAINRTINIDYFKKLLELKNVQFYSFQLDDIFDGVEKYPQMVDLKQELNSFDDTASALSNLDLFISADTACVHVAGAIGVKSYLLIPYCSDWRWFDNTEKTEWYDSVNILKQQDRQDWFIEADKIYNIIEGYKK